MVKKEDVEKILKYNSYFEGKEPNIYNIDFIVGNKALQNIVDHSHNVQNNSSDLLLNIWLNSDSECRDKIECIFYILTGYEFDSYINKCVDTLENFINDNETIVKFVYDGYQEKCPSDLYKPYMKELLRKWLIEHKYYKDIVEDFISDVLEESFNDYIRKCAKAMGYEFI